MNNNNNREVQSQFYIVKEFMWRDLKLDIVECAIYAIISSYKFYICNVGARKKNADPTSLVAILGLTETPIRNRLEAMVEDGILAKEQIQVEGAQQRNIYVACYDEHGIKDEEEINALLKQGKDKAIAYYSQTGKKRYVRGSKARRRKDNEVSLNENRLDYQDLLGVFG
jgi:hypothetical protein